MKSALRHSIFVICCLVFAPGSWALDDGDGTAGVNCNQFNQYGNPYFGDTHAHTKFSVDAYAQGVETTPEQAYRFAKGEEIGLHPFDENGLPMRSVQLERPLDFAMVADHAEFFGEFTICTDPSHPLYSDPNCALLRQRDNDTLVGYNVLNSAQPNAVSRFDFCGPGGGICTQASQTIWQQTIAAAEAAYDRSADCTFTSFIGYEWTGSPLGFPGGGVIEVRNLHRNVLFANSLVPPTPASYLDAPYPEDLWDDLTTRCLNTGNETNGCDVLTIPHNSNLSQGLMFTAVDRQGSPYTKSLAARRAKFEPLIEIMQHKGQSECLKTLANNDELCEFEIVPWGHLAGNFTTPTIPKVEGTVRNALKEGLIWRKNVKANPFQYGFIGSTDTHLGTPGLVSETNYPGHGGAAGGASGQTFESGITDTPEFNPGGLAVVWATQNSRAALFDAMRRRETYATSGPRHIVRFHAGWGLPNNICSLPDPTAYAFNNAVPMGSTLPWAGWLGEVQDVPKFLVAVQKDNGGITGIPGNDLQRIQIVKGWTDSTGQKHEQVFEVAGDPFNTASVNPNTCETIGSGVPELCQWWEDPDFDGDQNAFYYARVIETPSCRWTQRQCVEAIAGGVEINCAAEPPTPQEYAPCCNEALPKTVQERSWTSPIWYNAPVARPAGCS